MTGGLCGLTRSSWQNSDIVRRHIESGRKVGEPGRNIEILFKCQGVRKAKAQMESNLARDVKTGLIDRG